MSQAEASTKTRTTTNIKEPPMFKLIYINDNQTAMEFVVETLISYFDYSNETAMEITQNIHESGSATVAVLPYEIAEQKGVEITLQARSEGYPLQVKLEPDTI